MLRLRLVTDTNVVISAALKPEGLQRTSFLTDAARADFRDSGRKPRS
jgi:predicted nucleic acid-binding protein